MTQTLESPPAPATWQSLAPRTTALLYQQRAALIVQYRDLVTKGEAGQEPQLLNVIKQLAVVRQALENEIPALSRDIESFRRVQRMQARVDELREQIKTHTDAWRLAESAARAFVAAGLTDWKGSVTEWEKHRDGLFQIQHEAQEMIESARDRLGPAEQELRDFKAGSHFFAPIE